MISNYDEAIEKIFTTEAMRDYSLERVAEAYELLGRPLDNIQIIHIAGTNGKGSVARMTFSILQQAKKSVGVFTSPHLIDIRERFATDTGLISETEFVEYTNRLLGLPFALSYFEKCTLIAMLLFAERGVQYAILEVGMGGRLDATNICTPTITAITSIGLDHQQYLGDTLEAIATEKAGIIKPGIPIILSDTNPTIESIALDRKAPLVITYRRHQTNLHGAHQQHNAAIAYEIARYLGIDDETIHTGLQSVQHLGRCHHLRPNLLIDGAHNPEGLTILQDYIQTLDYDQLVYCIGLKSGKSPSIILDKFGTDTTYMIIDHEHSMTTDPHDLQSQLNDHDIQTQCIDPVSLIRLAEHNPTTLYVVCGSLYMIGQFYTDIQH